VVLGNRWKAGADNQVYASVVSSMANRATMVKIAREGYTAIPFDIGNAFVRASMGDIKVCIRLPPSFLDQSQEDDGKRILLKALYGLPISPRLWAKTLNKDLEKLGWRECKFEPGVWTIYNPKNPSQHEGFLTVYVDDCILAGKNPEIAKRLCSDINSIHPLTQIKTKVSPDGTIAFDLCGADVEINSRKRTLRISMAAYADKLLKRFKMTDCKPRNNPGFEESRLYDKKSATSTFPYRECVGGLQWLATTARPDLAHATNCLARAGAQPVTQAMAKCCGIVLRYLKYSREVGLEYSPAKEEEFEKVFGDLSSYDQNTESVRELAKNPIQTHTDASYGVVFKSLKSISGVVCFLYGMPVSWRSTVQTIFTNSTMESEWVALSDGIQLEESVYSLAHFLTNKSKEEFGLGGLWCDNRAVVHCSKRDTESLPSKSRHVSLRHAHVATQQARISLVPTEMERADGLTKSISPAGLMGIFNTNPIRDRTKKGVISGPESILPDIESTEEDPFSFFSLASSEEGLFIIKNTFPGEKGRRR
jgi:hypothetical protein